MKQASPYLSSESIEASRLIEEFTPDGNLAKAAWRNAKWIQFDRDMSGKQVLPQAATGVAAGPRPGRPGGAGAAARRWVGRGGTRGPGAAAQVAFKSSQSTVTMVVSCSAGVPSATTQVQNSWGGDD